MKVSQLLKDTEAIKADSNAKKREKIAATVRESNPLEKEWDLKAAKAIKTDLGKMRRLVDQQRAELCVREAKIGELRKEIDALKNSDSQAEVEFKTLD